MAEELQQIVTRIRPSDTEGKKYGFNSNFFTNGGVGQAIEVPVEAEVPRRGRPPKTKRLASGGEYIAVEHEQEVSPINGNISYKRTYEDTTGMLQDTITQIDSMGAMIQIDMSAIRSNKQLKKKYDYIGILAGTATGLIGNKISAIREMNSVITNCHNLDMKRVKEMKLNEKEDDDKKIADMYNAMINIPMGTVQGMNFGNVTPMQLNSPSGTMGMVGVNVDSDVRVMDGDPGYQNYLRNMTPEQNAMVLEHNPNIQAVVVYNQETKDKFFDVIDSTTGQSIPNVPRPAEFLLKEMRPDYRTNTMRNSSANMDFPMVLVGDRAIDEY